MNLFKVVVLGVLTVAMLGSTSLSQVGATQETLMDQSLDAEVAVSSSPLRVMGDSDHGANPGSLTANSGSAFTPGDDVDAETVCCMGPYSCYKSELGCFPGDYTVSCPCPRVN